jgi:hypothetical protein
MFGALSGTSDAPPYGQGVPREALTLGLLVLPAIWDWYVQWREARRGFYTVWEVDMLVLGASLTRRETGWLRQHPQLATRLMAIPGVVSNEEIERVQADWDTACDLAHDHALGRAKEIGRVARVHRDPFLPILEADSPLGADRQITSEILAQMPDEARYPKAAAEAVRSFLMLRPGLHLGVRQKNLRRLLLCPRGSTHRTERQLETLKRGELRWSTRDHAWEVLIPSAAFKNANSSFFGKRPFRLLLPDF